MTTTRVLIHSPKGGQGKTTLTANLAMMLAERGKRVLAVDCCGSKGLQLYLNVEAETGVSELLAGTPGDDLVGEVRPNLWFLPGGDLVEAERILTQNKLSPFLDLEEHLKPLEERFDFVLFDTAPTEDSRLFFAVLFYCDRILMPIETKRAGLDLLARFASLLEGINPRLREREGKPPLTIDAVVPYWYSQTLAKTGVLEILRKDYRALVTEPVGECTGLIETWTRGESLADRLRDLKTPRPNEAHILRVFEGLVTDLLVSKAPPSRRRSAKRAEIGKS
jgi:chromosome partitioning protein